jgi:tetratricopeptide (TPR) repeat protein
MTQGQAQANPDESAGKQKVIIAVLALVALASVFLLPRFVSDTWISDGGSDRVPVADTSASSVSPSTAAEKTRYRQDAQSVLAQIIPLRDGLIAQSVETWSPVEFKIAMDRIAVGDEEYSYGNYLEALDVFQKALTEFTELDTLGKQKLEEALNQGLVALESLNVGGAISASELATTLAPVDPEVLELASRATRVADLATHIESGDLSRQAGQLQAAQDSYQRAVDLDGKHQRASESLAAIKKEITDSQFRGHMSRAYAAMERDDFDAALEAFNQAATIYPGNNAMAQGRAQVANQNAQATVNDQITQAANYEATEDWSLAVSVYESLLEQDPTLTDIRVKLIPAKVRSGLDQRLEEFNEDPLRLSQQSIYRQAQVALNDAMGIPNPGPRLSGQVEELNVLLKRALTSVDVVFKSDSQTVVTLFRVAQLGQFEQTSLTLKPGKYIAGGTRQGFRDVRIEFTITGEPLDGPVVVKCEESI